MFIEGMNAREGRNGPGAGGQRMCCKNGNKNKKRDKAGQGRADRAGQGIGVGVE